MRVARPRVHARGAGAGSPPADRLVSRSGAESRGEAVDGTRRVRAGSGGVRVLHGASRARRRQSRHPVGFHARANGASRPQSLHRGLHHRCHAARPDRRDVLRRRRNLADHLPRRVLGRVLHARRGRLRDWDQRSGRPTYSCGGEAAKPATDIVFDGVLFHDVFWGVPSSEWGGSHPDCFEINGYVAAVVVRNSRFVRCASTFMQINPDQGDILNATFEKNVYKQLGDESWYGIQITSAGKPGRCGNVIFRRNTYLPSNPEAKTWPNGPIRTDCEPSPEPQPSSRPTTCSSAHRRRTNAPATRRPPYNTKWQHNLFLTGSCGAIREGSPSATASGTWASWRTDAPRARSDGSSRSPRADWPRASSHGGWRARTLPVLRAAAGTLGQSASS